MRFVLLALSILLMVGLGFQSCVMNNSYDNAIGGHIKRAADAQTVEMAREELAIAVHGCEEARLTTGYTSMFYRTPDEDIGFWYRNLNTSLQELTTMPAQATLLERSNVLMRLRSTLMHHGDHGERVNEPNGIEVYPNNAVYFWLSMLAAAMFLASFAWITVQGNRY